MLSKTWIKKLAATVIRSMRVTFIVLFLSLTAEAQQRGDVIAGAKWKFPGLAGPIVALEAPLGTPNSLAIASNGNLLIADTSNNIVLRLSADGTLQVVAGNGIKAYSGDGGSATAASLLNPVAIAIDKNDNLFIEDFGLVNGSNRSGDSPAICGIRKVTPGGTISTIAAGSFACGAGLAIGFTVDPAGNPVLSDGHVVRRVNADGSFTTVAGGLPATTVCVPGGSPNPTISPIGDGGPATSAALSPGPIAYDSAGNLYIGEYLHARIRRVDTNGIISTIAGLGSDCSCGMNSFQDGSIAASARIGNAGALTVDAGGTVYFLEGADDCGGIGKGLLIRKIVNQKLSTALNIPVPTGPSPVSFASIAINGSGAATFTWGNRVFQSNSPDAAQTIAGNGLFRSTGDGGQAQLAPINDVMGVSTDGTGNVYLSERSGSRIRKISASGDISSIAGTGEPGCGGDGGPGVNAQVSSPYGVTGDSRGGVYIVDLGCDSVRHITSDGIIHTVTNSLAYDVALDQEGGLYVSQFAAGTQSGGQIVRISPDGQTTRFAQVSTWSLAVDPAGNLYITAAGKIQVISPSGTISDYADLDAYRLATDAAGNLYAAGVDGHVYKVDGDSVSPIDGLANVVALAAGIGDSLFVSQQPLVQDPAHSDNRIRKVSVSGRPVRSSHTNRDR